MEHLINTWHCESDGCEKTFYADLEVSEYPAFCPFCGDNYLADSKILVAQPLSSNKK